MLVENYVLDEIFTRRYRVPKSRYALVISHGIGAHGGIYDVFCTHHAAKGVDIWSYDAPGHGRSTTTRPRGQWTMSEWAETSVRLAEHVRSETGLPVFTLGSSLGVAAAYSALHSDAIVGAILMGAPVVPSSPMMMMRGAAWRSEALQQALANTGRAARLDVGILFNFDEDYGYPGAGEQKRLDPWNTWSYDLASWASLFTYDPKIPVGENKKPILVASGEKDPTFPPAVMKMTAESIAGPVTLKIFDGASHQLMLFHTADFSTVLDDFVVANI
ncbi:MAG TPA: alpha/beta hydrolase [Candidatus Binatia bacterium]|nr:alpha/beta hydrolase [Candidatus Binatia bacterium]